MTVSPFLSYEYDAGNGVAPPRGRLARLTPNSDGRTLPPVQFDLDYSALSRATGRLMPASCADLLETAFLVSLADRVSPRSVIGDKRAVENRWPRRLAIRLPVRDPDRWQYATKSGILGSYLGFLPDDLWEPVFVPRPPVHEVQQLLLGRDYAGDVTAVQFSGGMDSYFGLVNAGKSLPKRGPLFAASVITNSRLLDLQSELLRQLRAELKVDLRWVPVRASVNGVGRGRDERESSWRTRSFFYLAVGAVTASLSRAEFIELNENGVGAINLPMTDDVISSMNTRAAHPRALALFENVLDAVLDDPPRVVNRFLKWTKGEMCELVSDNRFLREQALNTVSCDRFPYESVCGRCVPCLLRTISLCAAGFQTLVTGNSTTQPFDHFTGRPMGHPTALHAMSLQSQRLRFALGAQSPGAAMIEEFPSLIDVIAADARTSQHSDTMKWVVQLYSRYLAEWDRFTCASQDLAIAA